LIDFEVRQLQHLSTSFFGNSLRAFLWSAVLSANLAHLLTDREAAWRHARDPVPDAQRRPISIRRLADQIEQPYETVRRHIRAMVAAGALVDANGGVIVPRPLNPQPAWELYNERLLTAFGRMIGDLTRIGFRMPPS